MELLDSLQALSTLAEIFMMPGTWFVIGSTGALISAIGKL